MKEFLMSKTPKTEINIRTTFSNAHGKRLFSSNTPVTQDLVSKDDVILEFKLNGIGINRLGSLIKDNGDSISWSYPLEASLPQSGDHIGTLEVKVFDKQNGLIAGSTCDVFGKAAEGRMIIEENLIAGGADRHNRYDLNKAISTGTERLVGKVEFTYDQKEPHSP